MKVILLFLIPIFTFFACSHVEKEKVELKTDKTEKVSDQFKEVQDTLIINCDSIYKSNGYRLTLKAGIGYENNTTFIFERIVNGKKISLYAENICCRNMNVKFVDYNNDKIKDILIQNSSDVRSNWTYYLYLVNPKTNTLRKVKGFEEIKNPTYNSKYRVIENYVNSGQNWTEFYGIQEDSVFNYGITIYDEIDEKGNSNYELEYKKAVKTITSQNSTVSNEQCTKIQISKSDSSVFLVANIKTDYKIFGYKNPDLHSKKLILFSVFTNDVENNPHKCELGSYYQTSDMENMHLKYIGNDEKFVKIQAFGSMSKSKILHFERKYVEFNNW